MNGTIKVLCYKSKTLSNGEHPLMLCTCKDGKKKYQSIGISILPSHWDFKRNEPNDRCHNKIISVFTMKEQRRNVCSTLLLYVYVVRLMTYVGLVLGVVAVTLNVYGIEKVIDAFHFFGSV